MKITLVLAFLTSIMAIPRLVLNDEFKELVIANQSHYGDPKQGCLSDEISVQIQGVTGDFCTSACTVVKACPTDVPATCTATPMCALQEQTTKKKYCALICTPGDNDACGTNASCKSISGTGLCTYDD